MMEFKIQEAVRILTQTPETVRRMLDGLPGEWLTRNEGLDTWSPFDVVGHLIHGERTDWIPRAKIILEHGLLKPFDPFDRNAQFVESRGKTASELLNTFAELRRTNIQALQAMNLSASDLDKQGMHPALGVVTLRQLLATWVVHDVDHIAQIARVVGKQYGDEVGPWKAYLGILKERRV